MRRLRTWFTIGVLLVAETGCASWPRWPQSAGSGDALAWVSFQAETDGPAAASLPVGAAPSGLGGQPVEAYVARALAENRTVQAAFHNVRSLRYRLPQVMALDDPVASNSVFPIPAVGPQYSLMGYNPYNLTLAQQFPWFGTLRLRGEVAARDVQVALEELAAAQLDAVAAVKRAYYDLYAGQRTEAFLSENRKLLEDFRTVAARRVEGGGSQQDVIRAEVLLSELDRDTAVNRQAVASARAALARQLHVGPDADLTTLPELGGAEVPAAFDTLYALALAVRPELKGRLAAVARDEKAVELAAKRYYPNVTLGLTYMDMEKTNAVTPRTASGVPNVGLFVAFNLPVYRDKYRAGVCEAKERALADARLYEAQRDEARSEISDLLAQAQGQREVLRLLRDEVLPRARQTLENAGNDYGKGNVDFATLISALRETLQVRLQVVQGEAELGKALAGLERAVGCRINERPPGPPPTPVERAPGPPPASEGPGPFPHAPPPQEGPGVRPAAVRP